MSIDALRTLVVCSRSAGASAPDGALEAAQQAYLADLGAALVGSGTITLADGTITDTLAFTLAPAAAWARADASPYRVAGRWTRCDARDATPMLPAAHFDASAVPALRMVAMPADLNPGGGIFGGWLLAQMDQAAGIEAWSHSGGRCASVALAMSFDAPVAVGDDVRFHASILSQGRSSLRILVDAWARARSHADVRLVGRATFTYVALDADGKPRVITAPAPNAQAGSQ